MARHVPPTPREDTLSAALERLRKAGYTEDFHATAGGLRPRGREEVIPPERVVVEDLVRFEGITNPDDEAVLFAVRAEPEGPRGTYTVGFGPNIEGEDADMVQRLTMRRLH